MDGVRHFLTQLGQSVLSVAHSITSYLLHASIAGYMLLKGCAPSEFDVELIQLHTLW